MTSLFLDWLTYSTWGLREAPGLVETTFLQLDSDPAILLVVCLFESREAYVANSARPGQHAEYLQLMEFLATAPEWNDGDILFRG